MKVIIAGSRTITDYKMVEQAILDSGFEITEIVSGCARGVDKMGEYWAACNKVPVHQFPAQWGTHGRAAGPIRNAGMAEYADALIAIWDGSSSGTRHMIDCAKRKGLKIHILQHVRCL